MTDEIRRWRDEGDDLPRGLREALEAGQGDLPSAREIAALEASVLGAIGGGGGGGGGSGGGGGGGAGSVAAKGAGLAWAAGAGAVVVVLAGAVALWSATRPSADERREDEPVVVARLDESSVVADAGIDAASTVAIAEPAPTAPEPVGTPRRRAPTIDERSEPQPEPEVAREPESESESESEPAALDEVALLGAARRALRTDPTEALAITDRMTAVPSPAWAEERERVAIEALHRLGRDGAARARLDRFVASYPRSAYRVRLEEILAGP